MPEQSSKFFRNDVCQYFPCHKTANPENFNCLFCFCPLHYRLDCGGAYKIRPSGAKDCSGCIFPHQPQNYDKILEKLRQKVDPDKLLACQIVEEKQDQNNSEGDKN